MGTGCLLMSAESEFSYTCASVPKDIQRLMRIVLESKYTNFDFKTTSYVKDLIVSRIFEMLAESKIYFQPLKWRG